MPAANINIILIAAGFALLIILGTVFYLMSALNKPRKEQKKKLARFNEKFSARSSSGGARSIRLQQEEADFAAALASMLPNREEVEKRLAKTGLPITMGQYAMFSVALFAVLTVVFVLIEFPIPLALPLAVVAGIGLPHFLVGKIANARLTKFTSQFPEAIDLMVRGLKSGLPVNETLISVGQEMDAPIGTEFKKLTDEVKFGKTLEDALWTTSNRLDTPDFKFFVISLAVQRETGGNLGETLDNLATILRSRQAMKLKIKALSSEAKASAWIVGLLPFIMFGIILLMNYDYGIILIEHPMARLAAIGALIWMSIGVFIMAKMIDFEA